MRKGVLKRKKIKKIKREFSNRQADKAKESVRAESERKREGKREATHLNEETQANETKSNECHEIWAGC
jgi:hypothetical protein